MRYKQSDKSIVEIARELRADAVLKGSIARTGDLPEGLGADLAGSA